MDLETVTHSGGPREVKRVSECLEESPVLLALPLPPKSWDALRPKGVSTREGKGVEEETPVGRKRHMSLAGEHLQTAIRGVCMRSPREIRR